MTLQDKVKRLVRYCGQYQSHGFMMDERNTDEEFNVELQEEADIRKSMEQIKVILLTGEAGDGKSRILRNLDRDLKKNGFSQVCSDFSALSEQEKENIIICLKGILQGEREEKIVISANIGVFTQAVIRHDMHLMEELTKEREDVFICNFENRNLAENEKVFRNIVEEFLGGIEVEQCENMDCPCRETCVYGKNINMLLSDAGMEGMRTICNAIYLTGGHITFRELLSLLAYAVTFGQDCEERQRHIQQGEQEQFSYYNIFEKKNDLLLNKISSMDPALKKEMFPDRVNLKEIHSKEEYIRRRRQLFFEEKEKQYQMLNVDYLMEFYDVLQYMNQPPYHYDTIKEKKDTLQQLKKGIGKMSNRGKSDIGLIVTDTPAMFDNRIRTEFMVLQDMSMIWHRYDVKLGSVSRPSNHLWNKFYLSYLSNTGTERKLISLLIDYKQFRYLMMSSQDFFLNRSELTVEEYAVNTFYRKILQEREQAYESIVIRFDEKSVDKCDFSLTVHCVEDIFTGEKTETIRIRKED